MNRPSYIPIRYVLTGILLFVAAEIQALPRCLHVMSYHQGYEWSDGIEAGVENILRDKCELRTFYMDSKRNTSPEFIKGMALKAKQLITDYRPDVVIASDDNASRYLVQVFYKDVALPFVFAGINWTADIYGYPYKNATGMVEVAPVVTMLEMAKRNVSNIREVAFLSADVLTEHKDYDRYVRIYEKKGVAVRPVFVKDMTGWIAGFKAAQTADFIILGNNAGINDWNNDEAINVANRLGKSLTMTTYQWMMPFSMLGVSKVAAEQGEWAAEVALEILSGTDISDIPVTVNRHWIFYQNKKLLKNADIALDSITRHKAISKNWAYEKN